MRHDFVSWIEKRAEHDPRLIFLSGDLGFHSFEQLQQKLGHRFINAGVAEQNMVSVAAGLAREGFHPICYSIAPFIVFRAYEQLRIDLGLHQLPVKVVGNGGGYGYGNMGSTHHAIEDLAVAGALPNFRCFVPFSSEDVEATCEALMAYSGPAYLRLGFGSLATQASLPCFAPIRAVHKDPRARATVAVIGSVGLHALRVIHENRIHADLFAISEVPLFGLTQEFCESVRKTNQLLIIEEHVIHGGIGEALALLLLKSNLAPRIEHLYALGYPGERSGSQAYHQQQSRLDAESIGEVLAKLVRPSPESRV